MNTLISEIAQGSEKPDIGTSFMGIEGERIPVDFRGVARSMGIGDEYIFVTTSDPKQIRHTFGKMSQSAMSDLAPAV